MSEVITIFISEYQKLKEIEKEYKEYQRVCDWKTPKEVSELFDRVIAMQEEIKQMQENNTTLIQDISKRLGLK